MAKKMKKLFSLILAMSMVMSLVSVMASAAQEGNGATKTSEKIEGTRYQVEVSVPGKDGDNRHDEVILMVDGSYSLDGEWPAMKEAINTIAETVLNGSGNTKLTLMAFGMGDNVVIQDADEASKVANVLGSLPGSLLYGRSSTNCEAGFTGVAKYIANHDDTLKDVHVIYISDGNINTDETPRAFDANWQTWTKFGALTVAQVAFEETLCYYIEDDDGNIIDTVYSEIPEAFYETFGTRFNDAQTREEILDRAYDGAVSD